MIDHLVLSEFYNKIQEALGREIADHRLLILKASKNKIVAIDFYDIHKIGDLNTKNRKLSIVDSVIGVIAKRLKAIIMTTDHDFNNITNIKGLNLSN